MIKHFCDICGQEITEQNDSCLSVDAQAQRMVVDIVSRDKRTGFRLQIMHASSSPVGSAPVWNKGDICKYCIIDGIEKLDDRPKEDSRR